MIDLKSHMRTTFVIAAIVVILAQAAWIVGNWNPVNMAPLGDEVTTVDIFGIGLATLLLVVLIGIGSSAFYALIHNVINDGD